MKTSFNEIALNQNCAFSEVYEIFKDVIYSPTEEKVQAILRKYNAEPHKILYGYFEDTKLIGITGIQDDEVFEILYFGVHPLFRGKGYGTRLMDFIKTRYAHKKLYLTTDDDAVVFYRKYGFTVSEYYEDINGKITKRYKCILE
jgi:ribosomal protein S18 acetylase RimI-like enzyme